MKNNIIEYTTPISSSDLYTAYHDFAPNYTVQFRKDDVIIGTFDFAATPATFIGDVDESAKLFCDAVIKWMPEIIEKYK